MVGRERRGGVNGILGCLLVGNTRRVLKGFIRPFTCTGKDGMLPFGCNCLEFSGLGWLETWKGLELRVAPTCSGLEVVAHFWQPP